MEPMTGQLSEARTCRMDRCPPKLKGIGSRDQPNPRILNNISVLISRAGRNRHAGATYLSGLVPKDHLPLLVRQSAASAAKPTQTFMPKSSHFPRPLVMSPGALAGWISRNWKLSKADRIRLEMTAIHEPNVVMDVINSIWAAYRGTPRVPLPPPYRDKTGKILGPELFNDDWEFVANPPGMNPKLAAEITKRAEAGRKKKST